MEKKLKQHGAEIERLEEELMEKNFTIEQLTESLQDYQEGEKILLEKIHQKEKEFYHQIKLNKSKLPKEFDEGDSKSDVTVEFVKNPMLQNQEEIIANLERQVSQLKGENKEFEKLMKGKNEEIHELNFKVMENEMMSKNVKHMFEELLSEHEQLEKKNSQKEV